jgi:hypothetical protein
VVVLKAPPQVAGREFPEVPEDAGLAVTIDVSDENGGVEPPRAGIWSCVGGSAAGTVVAVGYVARGAVSVERCARVVSVGAMVVGGAIVPSMLT